ncbi:MAG: sodium:solute symporter [Armatimonadetes bacterium]|nr:sodium:solute symporter [Armatimonadota bacterium]
MHRVPGGGAPEGPFVPHLPALDLVVVLVYLGVMTAYGCWFARKKQSSDEFMAAGRSLPGWAVGLSIFGSYVSSISFLANPGKAFSGNWNSFVFGLSLPLAAWIAVRYFVPFYRKQGDISAYHHLEQRFGPWARTYAVACYLLTQLARMGTILYLLALALQPLLGWDVKVVILMMGVVMTVYPFLGGTEAVIWVGVVQAGTLVVGALICLVFPILGMPGGLDEILRLAGTHQKFSFGSPGPSLTEPTYWVVLIYGLCINLQNFGIDQSYVQRYITARTDRDAARSVWMGALLYIPLSACFFFIGTALFAFYTAQPTLLPAGTTPDAVLPHFIRTQLPAGLAGVIVAAICAAALDSNLNCMATLTLCDIYRRYFRPEATERESMRVLHVATLGFGVLGTIAALAMIREKSALDQWWKLAGIFGGGTLGLFLLGMVARGAGNRAAIGGTLVGVVVILWMSLSPDWSGALAPFKSPFHSFLTIVFGTLAILLVGFLLSTRAAKGHSAPP